MSSLRDRLNRHLKPGASSGNRGENTDSREFEEEQTLKTEELSAASDQQAAASEQLQVQLSASISTSAADPEEAGWSRIGAVLQSGEWGDFITRRLVYEPAFQHGHYALGDLEATAPALQRLLQTRKKAVQGRPMPARDAGLAAEGQPDKEGQAHLSSREYSESQAGSHVGTAAILPDTGLEQLLFIDTETTGLGQGAGNVPFMVGIGYFEDGGFVVEQMLIRHPGEEASMLSYLQTRISERPVLISYNGKSFDWPIVNNRFILNRIPLPSEPQGHIDFLYPSRSLWKTTLASCRLGQVEEDRLGVLREDDVPGSLAPALYFQYLAERDPAILEGVFRHNEWDILTLVGLAVHFGKLLTGETGFEDVRTFGREEWFRYGKWMDRCGLKEVAMLTMEALAEELTAPECAEAVDSELPACVLPLARFLKKSRQYDLAGSLWKLYIQRQGQARIASLEPFIELSMYGEHKLKDLELALRYAKEAQDVLWRRQALERRSIRKEKLQRAASEPESGETRDEEAELLKRIDRLERKQLAAAARKRGGSPTTGTLDGTDAGNAVKAKVARSSGEEQAGRSTGRRRSQPSVLDQQVLF
ncbi:ribonuclease H-like domain-containing protein [Paenibacillus filicis]|uniref:Ribonuclease H-like domain-containing protein n=1 Tax=Paenibacillus filicis TaxID=669464 RepID=A0ABU9DIJ2_9BACL